MTIGSLSLVAISVSTMTEPGCKHINALRAIRTRVRTILPECASANLSVFRIVYLDDPVVIPGGATDPYPDIPRHNELGPDAGERRRLDPLNRGDLCATIMGDSIIAGRAVSM
jgi:hypothetical protein